MFVVCINIFVPIVLCSFVKQSILFDDNMFFKVSLTYTASYLPGGTVRSFRQVQSILDLLQKIFRFCLKLSSI